MVALRLLSWSRAGQHGAQICCPPDHYDLRTQHVEPVDRAPAEAGFGDAQRVSIGCAPRPNPPVCGWLCEAVEIVVHGLCPCHLDGGVCGGDSVDSKWLDWGLFLSLPFLFLAVYWQGRSQQGIRVSLLRSKEQMEGTIAEQLAGIEYIRCADTHELEESTISDKAESLRKVEMKHHSAMGWFDFLKTMIESVFFVAVTGLSIWLAGRGQIAVGEIVTSACCSPVAPGPVREIHRIIDEAAESSLSGFRFPGNAWSATR